MLVRLQLSPPKQYGEIMKAKVYGSSHCVWCDRVAKLLEDSGALIEKVDISQGKEFIKEMQEAAG